MYAEGQASCVLWYADSVVALVVVILHSQFSLVMNLTFTKMKIALIPRELKRKDTFYAISGSYMKVTTPFTRWSELYISYYKVMRSGSNVMNTYTYHALYCTIMCP